MSWFKIWASLLTCVLFLGGIFLYQKQVQHVRFAIEDIQFSFPYQEAWETSVSDEKYDQINHIFQQPFHYLGKGARSFAFLSEDGHYVLKFFKYRYHEPHWAIRFLPSVFPFEFYRQQKMKKVPLYNVLMGYKIAYDRDPEGTGLLYIHLNPTQNKHPLIAVTDQQGKMHSLSLDQTRFVLQRKAQEFTDLLHEYLSQHNEDLALQRIIQVFDLYRSHYQKGLYDFGIGILRNNGFIEEKPIHFDVGKMTLDARVVDPAFQNKQFLFYSQKIEQWLDQYYPESREKLMKSLRQWLSDSDSQPKLASQIQN